MASLVSSSATSGASLCWSSLCSSRRRHYSSTNNNNNNVVAASRRHHRSSSSVSSSSGRKKGRCQTMSFSSRQNREKSASWCRRVGRDAGVQVVVQAAAASKTSSGTSATRWGGSSASVEDVKKCALITAIKTPYLKSGKIDLQKYGTRAAYRRIVASSSFFSFFRILLGYDFKQQQRAIVVSIIHVFVVVGFCSIFVCLFVCLFVS